MFRPARAVAVWGRADVGRPSADLSTWVGSCSEVLEGVSIGASIPPADEQFAQDFGMGFAFRRAQVVLLGAPAAPGFAFAASKRTGQVRTLLEQTDGAPHASSASRLVNSASEYSENAWPTRQR